MTLQQLRFLLGVVDSGLNITAAKDRHREEKLEAADRFLRFVEENVRPAGSDLGSEDWRRLELRWFQSQIRGLMPMGPDLLTDALRRTDRLWPAPRALRAVCRRSHALNPLLKVAKRLK